MTPNEIAGKAAEEVFRTVEREQMFNKRQITEAIEHVLLTHQVTPSSHQLFMGGTAVAPCSICGSVTPHLDLHCDHGR